MIFICIKCVKRCNLGPQNIVWVLNFGGWGGLVPRPPLDPPLTYESYLCKEHQLKYYVLVGGKKDKHMAGNMDTLILITRGQYITMWSNTRIFYTRQINNTLSPFFKKNNKNKTM